MNAGRLRLSHPPGPQARTLAAPGLDRRGART